MSSVSYFQRFSQAENHATNNTLLILRYFYQASPQKLQSVLTSLTDTELAIGITFEQQVKGSESVPDALISQEPLNVYIETKRSGELYPNQILRHLNSIENSMLKGTKPLLIGLTTEPISLDQRTTFTNLADEKRIGFASVTFSEVVEALRAQCEPHETVLNDIVNDYEIFLLLRTFLKRVAGRWLCSLAERHLRKTKSMDCTTSQLAGA